MATSEEVAAALESINYQTSERLLGSGLVASDETSAGAAIFGLEIDDDAEVSLVFERISQGEWLSESAPKGVVVGRALARTLHITIGDELVLLSQAYDGSMANDLFTVRGVLSSISEVTDRGGVFMPSDTFREFYALQGGAHRLMVKRPNNVDLDQAVIDVKDATAKQELEVKSWRELSPILATLIDSALQLMQVGFLIIYVAVVIMLLNAMLMAVFERIREFGILKAIGVSPASVLALILMEGVIQTIVAITLAFLLCIPALWYLVNVGINLAAMGNLSLMGMSFDPIFHGVVTAKTIYMPLTTMMVIVLLGVLYPAIKAARITPIEAIHHQ
ncbi:MAG TPA: FtsX-like permease family protein, partial [Pseudomonadales bacterium]|nr:FtsX-like permease family protein [Pseudomonadales bacterium]